MNKDAGKARMEFIFSPDGSFKLEVHDMAGTECMAVSRPFEQELGKVIDKQRTAEYYKQSKTASIETNINI